MQNDIDTIDPTAVERSLRTTALAGAVTHLAATGSTNELAINAVQNGATRGIWVADEQTAGRGRAGHTWHSTRGHGLYVSVLITPDLPLDKALWLSLATGLAAQQAIEEVAHLHIDLRWPNDLLFSTRKVGGILVESTIDNAASRQTARLRHAVIGVGINVHHRQFPSDLRTLATSLALEGAPAVSRQAILIALLRALDSELHMLEREHVGLHEGIGILGRFASASSWVRGKHVRVPEDGGYTGVTAGLDSRGFLLVDSDDGKRRTVLSGGVRDL